MLAIAQIMYFIVQYKTTKFPSSPQIPHGNANTHLQAFNSIYKSTKHEYVTGQWVITGQQHKSINRIYKGADTHPH
jgi:predicted metal-dependent phosphoesterase TrpH